MKKHSFKQLVKAMICCLPAVFAGCAIEPTVQTRVKVSDAAPILPAQTAGRQQIIAFTSCLKECFFIQRGSLTLRL